MLVYLILNIFAIVLLVFLGIWYAKHFKKNKENIVTVFLKFLGLLALLIIPIIIVNQLPQKIEFTDEKDEIQYLKEYELFFELNDFYYDKLQKNPKNLGLNFEFANAIKLYIDKTNDESFDPKSLEDYYRSRRVVQFYTKLISKGDSTEKDIGNLLLAYHYFNLTFNSKALEYLKEVKNQNQPYFYFTKGIILAKSRSRLSFTEAENLLQKSISRSTRVKESISYLAYLYYYYREEQKLTELITKYESILPSYPVRSVYFSSFQILNYWKQVLSTKFKSPNIIGISASLLIMLIWLLYLRKLDIYEPEKWSYIVLTFFMSCITIFFVYPIGDFLTHGLGYFPSYHSGLNFIYITISIGIVEELVKAIPVLIIMKFTKAINEPYDYIFYFAVSALGFAFIENIGYIDNGSLYNISARAFMATVAHITFSSTIGYGLMLSKYRNYKRPVFFFFLYLLIAATMHGFYDYWLIDKWASNFDWITTIFFIISVHAFHIYANNSMNISNFYVPEIKIKNDNLKLYLIFSLIGIFVFSHLVNGVFLGRAYANDNIIKSTIFYGYFILYLTFSLSRFTIIRGYFAPINIPINILIPRVKNISDYSNVTVLLLRSSRFRFTDKFDSLKTKFPAEGILERRFIIDNQLNSYLVRLNKEVYFEDKKYVHVAILPKSSKKKLDESGRYLCKLYLINPEQHKDISIVESKTLEFVGWIIVQKTN